MTALETVLAAGLQAWAREFSRTANGCRHYYVKQNGQWVCAMCGQPG